jgi:hypothetical protein
VAANSDSSPRRSSRLRPASIALAICYALQLGLPTTALAATPAPKPAAQGAKVRFVVAPTRVVCKDDIVRIVVSYDSGDIVPLAPLVPLSTEGSDTRSNHPGTLSTKAAFGEVSKPSVSVDYGSGFVGMNYFAPSDPEVEIITSSLSYLGTVRATQDAPFRVEECPYRLRIMGWAYVDQGNSTAIGWMDAEGDIGVSGDAVIGEMNIKAAFNVRSEVSTQRCQLTPLPSAKSKVLITGKVVKRVFGDAYLYLNLTYEPITGFPKAEMVCAIIKSGEVTRTPFAIPKSIDPADYLYETLDFSEGNRIDGPYGSIGEAHYTLWRNP